MFCSSSTSSSQDEHYNIDQNEIRSLYTTSIHKPWFKVCEIYRSWFNRWHQICSQEFRHQGSNQWNSLQVLYHWIVITLTNSKNLLVYNHHPVQLSLKLWILNIKNSWENPCSCSVCLQKQSRNEAWLDACDLWAQHLFFANQISLMVPITSLSQISSLSI